MPIHDSPLHQVLWNLAVQFLHNVCHKQINKQTMQKALLHLQLLPWWRNDYSSVSEWTPWCEHTFWMSPSRRGGGGTRWWHCFWFLSSFLNCSSQWCEGSNIFICVLSNVKILKFGNRFPFSSFSTQNYQKPE